MIWNNKFENNNDASKNQRLPFISKQHVEFPVPSIMEFMMNKWLVEEYVLSIGPQNLKRGVVTMLDKKDVRNVDYLSFVMI